MVAEETEGAKKLTNCEVSWTSALSDWIKLYKELDSWWNENILESSLTFIDA